MWFPPWLKMGICLRRFFPCGSFGSCNCLLDPYVEFSTKYLRVWTRYSQFSYVLYTVGTVKNVIRNKVEKILKGRLDLIPSPSPSVIIQFIGRKVCLRCKGKTLLGIVNELLETKSLLTTPSNVLPYCLK